MEGKHLFTARERNRHKVITVYEWVGVIVATMSVLLLLLTYVVRVVGVNGESMLPTLHNGDRLLLSCLTKDYGHGDIVVIDRYTEEPLIKRIVAVEGDTISIEDGEVYVNGLQLNESYIQGTTINKDFHEAAVVPKGCVFVMGDNRSDSKDSRMKEIGMISEKDIVGKVLVTVWPPSSISIDFGDDNREE